MTERAVSNSHDPNILIVLKFSTYNTGRFKFVWSYSLICQARPDGDNWEFLTIELVKGFESLIFFAPL